MMTGTISQLSTSRGGVPKRAIGEGFLTATGIEGDLCAHPQFHGGPKQAVLLICEESIEALRASGFPVFAGALGENLTTRGIDRRAIRFGHRFRVGEAAIEITKLRVPCAALNRYGLEGRRIQPELYDDLAKAGNPESPAWGMGGFYASVVETGRLRPDDIITLLD